MRESLMQSGENLLLILENRVESTLVFENARLILQYGRLVLFDRGLIRPECSLIGNDGLLILDNRLLISDHIAFRHCVNGLLPPTCNYGNDKNAKTGITANTSFERNLQPHPVRLTFKPPEPKFIFALLIV